jgi:hypothetical protein
VPDGHQKPTPSPGRTFLPSAALGIEVGNFARSVIDYKELRDSHKAKIAELEQKVANEADPGEKAELQRDLDYWKRIDKWSSEMEGTALRAMGIYNIPDFYALGTAVIKGLNNLDQYERQQAAKQRLDFATSVRQRFERSVRKQPGDDKLLAYSPVELLTMSEIDRELFFKAVQDPKVKAQIEADWKANRLISNVPLNVAFAVSDPLTNMAIRAPPQVSREPASSNPTPIPAPTSAPTPYPGAAGLWKEREQAVRQEYDAAWAAVPEAKRLQLHDDEASFQDTIKAFDPPTRMRTLKKRIELLKSFAPSPVRKL